MITDKLAGGLSLRIRIFLPVFLLACVVALGYVYLRPAIYRATARIALAPPAVAQAESSSARPSPAPEGRGDAQYLASEAWGLTSAGVLDTLLARLREAAPAVAEAAGAMGGLRAVVSAAAIEGSRQIELRAEGSERDALVPILREWIAVYSGSRSQGEQQDVLAALEARRADLEQLRGKIAAKRREIDEFRRTGDIVSLEREENQAAAQLKSLTTALNEARNRQTDTEIKLASIREGIAQGKPVTRPSDRQAILDLERRAAELREKLRDLEQVYSQQYLAMDPKVKTMRTNLARIEQQADQVREASRQAALDDAVQDLERAKQTVARLGEQFDARKRDALAFNSRFAEHKALMTELAELEASFNVGRNDAVQLELRAAPQSPRVRVADAPALLERPVRPDYTSDALIAAGGSLALAFAAVWAMEYLRRSGEPAPTPATQPIIQIAFPAIGPGGATHAFPEPMRPALLPGGHPSLPEPEPRELSAGEIEALWLAASADSRLALAGLFAGLSPGEMAEARWEDLDPAAGTLAVAGAGARALPLPDPLACVLAARNAATQGKGKGPWCDAHGRALTPADIDGLVACAAHDAGLAHADEVNAAAVRHTWIAWLVRQGVRLGDLARVAGPVPPADFTRYGRISPPGAGIPIDRIDPVHPALRAAALRG